GTGGAGTDAKIVTAITDPSGGVPVIFQGAAGGATVPSTLIIRQDATISDSESIPQAVQFGDGLVGPAGMSYTLRSDDGEVNLGSATRVARSFLTLTSNGTSTGGVHVSTRITPASLTINSTLASSI